MILNWDSKSLAPHHIFQISTLRKIDTKKKKRKKEKKKKRKKEKKKKRKRKGKLKRGKRKKRKKKKEKEKGNLPIFNISIRFCEESGCDWLSYSLDIVFMCDFFGRL